MITESLEIALLDWLINLEEGVCLSTAWLPLREKPKGEGILHNTI